MVTKIAAARLNAGSPRASGADPARMNRTRLRRILPILLGAAAALALLAPSPAHACGGFFCGQKPVDQQAERILFSVNDDGTVTMVVQITYQGDSEDFAWVLPLATVPAVESLDTFPQAALTALDANTGPAFQMPYEEGCWDSRFDAAAGPSAEDGDPGVTVHIRETVGPYDVAVIESTDPAALTAWLRDNDFRVTAPMEPYIRIYTEEGMKFLALRLQPGSDVNDIAPFKMTLPGQAPSVPIRLTSLAAEPEMGIAVFILGDMRYGPANWPEVDVDDSRIVWRGDTWPMETNWAALVAQSVDEAGGRGFVTEYAGSTASYLDLLRRSTPSDPEQEEAILALLEIMEPHPYMSRLYTRLSAEEMTTDPTFRRTAGGDVDRTRMLSRYVDGRDLCDIYDPETWERRPDVTTACDFTTCGAGGYCALVENADGTTTAGCACIPGMTARTTLDPMGRATVICQDMRMSFLNPGDREAPGETPLPDPCVGFDCGAGGSCVAMNMTPTCQCGEGLVAIGNIAEDGTRSTRCTTPTTEIPDDFYQRRPVALPAALPGGRDVVVPPPTYGAAGGGGCSATGAAHGAPFALAVGMLVLVVARRRSRR